MANYILSSHGNDVYHLQGDISLLLNNRRVKIMMSSLSFDIKDNILIFYSQKGIDEFAADIKLIIKFVKGDLTYDQHIDGELLKYKEEEDRFNEFSVDAADIKNNNCDIDDFDDFTNSLKKHMLCRTLYPLQLLSAYHMAFSQNACNFSVPGAGKTSIVYGAYTYLKNLPRENPKKVDKILIIGPLSSFGPWELEYEECFGFRPSCQRINGSMNLELKKQYFYDTGKELTLISYASVVSISDSIKYFLKNNRVMVVLDEAHKIKNTSGGVIATKILELSAECNARIVLTGTPSPNGYDDLYNLFSFIWPRKNVIKYNIAQLRDMSKDPSDSRIPILMDNLNPFYIRIKKSDLGIPEPIENPPIIVPMKDGQRRIYDFIEKRYIADLSKSDKDIHSAFVAARTIRLMQAATNPSLLREPINSFIEENDSITKLDDDSTIINEIIHYCDNEIPAKFEKCLELCNNIISRGEKVVIWAVFIKNIEYLSLYLKENGINNKTLYGATPVATSDMVEDVEFENTREAIIQQFHRKDSAFKVIIANPFAVAESISLHKVCHNAIYMERTFNCAHFMQSKDRIHRYGISPEIKTNYYYLESEDSIDSTISSRLKIKEDRMIAIIESMPIPLFSNITDDGRDDIRAMIQDYVKRRASTI